MSRVSFRSGNHISKKGNAGYSYSVLQSVTVDVNDTALSHE